MPEITTTDADLKIKEALDISQSNIEIITRLAETAKTSANEATESQKKLDAILIKAQAKLAEITAFATQAIAAKTQINDEQAVIATKSDHIQKAQEHADNVRASLDRTLTAATQQATETEGQKNRAKSAADAATESLTNIRTTQGTVETNATAIKTARETAEESAILTKELADKSATVEERIAAYEKRLIEIDQQCVTQLKTIESLLPGATGAGLAHAFDQRRITFLKPQRRWQWLFVGSLVAIVILAGSGLLKVYLAERDLTSIELLHLWLSRLPMAGALMWLAIHASRESALSKRLEEDYGYKSAVASSFLGFHRQMSEIDTTAAPNSPLAKLCEDTLKTIATPPGRIYDKHKLVVSPSDELMKAAKAVVEVANVSKP